MKQKLSILFVVAMVLIITIGCSNKADKMIFEIKNEIEKANSVSEAQQWLKEKSLIQYDSEWASLQATDYAAQNQPHITVKKNDYKFIVVKDSNRVVVIMDDGKQYTGSYQIEEL